MSKLKLINAKMMEKLLFRLGFEKVSRMGRFPAHAENSSLMNYEQRTMDKNLYHHVTISK